MEIESLEIRSKIAKIEYDITNMWKQIYPVGSVYLTIGKATPADLFGGTWEQVGKGRYLLGVDPSDETGHWDASDRTGGSREITLTLAQMPKHNHKFSLPKLYYGQSGSGSVYGQETQTTQIVEDTTQMTGEGEPFNITPPFYTVYMWKRTG